MQEKYFDPELRRSIERTLLPDIQRPGQYIGGESGQIRKDWRSMRGRFCFCFPDTYPIGMSNYTLQLLYSIINRKNDWCCERAFTPFPDMEALLRENRLPLYSLETFTPLFAFDVVGFTLQYELSYTNILTMLDLGGIPRRRKDRSASDPLIIAGGPAAFNPEPMSDFIDLYILGDGEESLPETCAAWVELKEKAGIRRPDSSVNGRNLSSDSASNSGSLRRQMLLEMARKFSWAYVPEFYSVDFDESGRARRPRPTESGVPEFIKPAILRDLDEYPPSDHPLVPLIESVQDRIAVEIMRGCPQSCRFCQSSPIKRPLRVRSMDQIVDLIDRSTQNTGTDEATLLSLSSSEFPHFEQLLDRLRETVCPKGVSLSVPSLRVDHQLSDVMKNLTTERLSSITIAPEAARDTMRKRIAKKVTDEDLMAGCKSAFENGFNRIKMYFMCGFPYETEEDIIGIIHLCDEIVRLGKATTGRYPTVVANVSNFVPKPHTPLQWDAMATEDYLAKTHALLRNTRRFKSVDLKYHGLHTSLLEGLMTRGDRRIGSIIENAWINGARMDAWTDYFQYDCWKKAIQDSGIDANLIVHTPYSIDAELPWDHITTFSGKDRLIREYNDSRILEDNIK
ncbi:MAG: radical SAM protein [Planctomycetia bacterium]|nr:radical SAM protein [Planctomycetia bacterium]